MYILQSQKGNALILVLIIMSIFSILFLSLMGQSLNNSKQLNQTEEDFQAVSLAEMGVIYYKTAISTAMDALLKDGDEVSEIYQMVKNKIELEFGEITNDNIEQIQSIVNTDPSYAILLTGEWKKRIISEEFFPEIDYRMDIDSINKSSFQISDVIVSNNKDGISFNFISKGIKNEKEIDLITTINIPFNGINLNVDSNGGGSDGDQENEDIPNGNEISDPGNLENCETDLKKVDFYNISCQFNGDRTFDQNDNVTIDTTIFKVTGTLTLANMNKDMINSTLFIQGDMTTGNLNSLNRLKLHVNGEANFGHFNGQGLVDSIVEIQKTATMDNIDLNNTKFYVGGNANFGIINSIVDSVIFINSDATIKGINIGNNSLICVNGHLTLEDNFNYNGQNSKVYAKSSNNTNVIQGNSAFEPGGACSRQVVIQYPDLDFMIDWGDTSLSSEYDYKY